MCCMSAPLQEEEPGTRLRRMSSAMADAAQRLELQSSALPAPATDKHNGSTAVASAAAAALRLPRSDEKGSSLHVPQDAPDPDFGAVAVAQHPVISEPAPATPLPALPAYPVPPLGTPTVSGSSAQSSLLTVSSLPQLPSAGASLPITCKRYLHAYCATRQQLPVSPPSYCLAAIGQLMSADSAHAGPVLPTPPVATPAASLPPPRLTSRIPRPDRRRQTPPP